MLLGLDIGTSQIKAVLVDSHGWEVGHAAAPTPFATVADRVEMEVDAFLDRLRRVLAELGGRRGQVAAVGVAGIAESGAPLDDAGHALAPVIAWHDGRGQEAAATLKRRFGTELAVRTGQEANAKMTAAKVGWLVGQGMRGMARWLGIPELVLHALTGAEATEHSLAARTGCYDVVARHWLPEVAGALGFTTDVFAAVFPAGSVMGRISAAGAAWSGLPEGAPVTIAGHDHLAGMAGAGVGRHDVANSVGTAEALVGRAPTVPDMAAALANRVTVGVYPGGHEWVAMVSAARAGLVIDGAAALLGRSPRDLDRLAAGARPVEMGDSVDRLARGASATLPVAPPGRIWAGVLHELTARTVDAYQRLTQVIGPVERVVVFGGGSACEPWIQAKAAALPVAVVRSAVTSAVARGAAVHAGVAAGWWLAD